jgi:hypothetical protein
MLPTLPLMVEFTNQVVLAISSAWPPLVYSDTTQATTNPATIVNISAISIDGNNVVTITTSTPHGLDTTQAVGANIVIQGVTNNAYNNNGFGVSAFPVISIPSGTQLKVVNASANGQAPSSGGTVTVTTVPIISNFIPAFPTWVASVNYSVNSIVVPTTSNGHYYVAVQGGTSGTAQPSFPTSKGGRVADGNIIWQEAGLLNTAAPAPPGAAHLAVYAGSLWVWDTAPLNTANGLDGPSSLRMSDVNNLSSWNPINQAFLDKDDGTEGMGLAVFTISAQGIPPQGSLIPFKLYSTFQIVGVFGATNFAIQRVTTDMGCVSPRTLEFVPGFGIGRIAHLGVAIFDGVNDRVISEQVRPYLFPSNDIELGDIVAMDATNQVLAWSAQTATPPMFTIAIPVGSSAGTLTRLLCFDMVLKSWAVIDLPFAIGTVYQARTTVANPVTVFGSYYDGTLQRWQSGDVQWATSSAGSSVPGLVAWSVRTPTTASKDPEMRLYCRRVIVIGQQGQLAPVTVTITPRVNGAAQNSTVVTMASAGRFAIQGGVHQTSDLFDAIINGAGDITIDSFSFDIVPKPIGVLAGFIA